MFPDINILSPGNSRSCLIDSLANINLVFIESEFKQNTSNVFASDGTSNLSKYKGVFSSASLIEINVFLLKSELDL